MNRLLLIILALLPLATACGGGDTGGTPTGTGTAATTPTATAVAPTEVTLMLDWTPNTNHTGFYVAKAKGWYDEVGLDVNIVEPATTGTAQVVGAGQAEFGVSVQEQAIPARAEGVPVVSIAAIIQHNTSSLMALASAGILRPRDLEGKTYGGFGGALETALVKTLITCDGGDPESVKFVDVGNVDYLIGMEQGQYDFVWIFDGWDLIRAREIEKKDVSTIPFIDYVNCIPDWYTPLIITNETMIREQPDTVRRFVEATTRGYEFAIDQPEEAARILLAAAPELDQTLVLKSATYLAQQYVEPGHPWGKQDPAVWTRFEEFLRTAGLVDRKIDVNAAFTNDFLPAR